MTDLTRRQHFLIVRLAGIGDVVMASAAARKLRDSRPDARISWLTGMVAAPLVECFADVDAVIAIDERRLLVGRWTDRASVLLPLWRRLLSAKITDILMLHVDRRYRVVIAPLVGKPVRAFARGRTPIRGRYFADECARLAGGSGVVHQRESLGPIEGHEPLGRLRDMAEPSPHRDRPLVAIVPGGARNVLREDSLRRWPVERYAALAKALEGHADVVLIGDAQDAWVRPSFEGLEIIDRIGNSSLPRTVDFFRTCDLAISHDTGPMHLARLAGAPLLALFGPTNPAERVPADDRTAVLWGGANLACRPCYDGRDFADCADNACMSDISVDVVLRTAMTMLARPARRAPVREATTVLS